MPLVYLRQDSFSGWHFRRRFLVVIDYKNVVFRDPLDVFYVSKKVKMQITYYITATLLNFVGNGLDK